MTCATPPQKRPHATRKFPKVLQTFSSYRLGLSRPQSEKKILIFYKIIQFCIVFKIPEAPPEFDRFRGPFSKFRGGPKSHPEFFLSTRDESLTFSAAALYLVTEKKRDFFGFRFPNAHKVASQSVTCVHVLQLYQPRKARRCRSVSNCQFPDQCQSEYKTEFR